MSPQNSKSNSISLRSEMAVFMHDTVHGALEAGTLWQPLPLP